MTEAAIFTDTDGHVIWLNPAARTLLLDDPAADAPHTFAELVRHHEAIDALRGAIATGAPSSATYQTAIEGRTLAIEVIPLGEALPGFLLVLVRDLTRLHQLEHVRRDFVSNISHELRTPLTSIKAITETLQSGALEDPGLARAFLGRLETELDALVQIVQELLELSRIESGQVPLHLVPVAPAALLTSAAERLRLQAERAGIELTVDAPASLPEVMADSPRLEQVLVNLLHNAIKFTPAGGRILLEAAPGEDAVRFAVRDNGVGVSREDLPRIFERFYKADRARSGGGTGLGLAIARHLAEAHGGRIWAESTEGAGASFYFTIPIVSADSLSKP
jgi:two-component system phosphate regulon sensor histidine kinase PhoR